ncbi:hypothetical protein [Pseudomonas prosekii]|uniref:hypothetical protein n=1 Tax=Pseudomonas prosekii TaxID=1148509 RepID=UPI003F74DFD7
MQCASEDQEREAAGRWLMTTSTGESFSTSRLIISETNWLKLECRAWEERLPGDTTVCSVLLKKDGAQLPANGFHPYPNDYLLLGYAGLRNYTFFRTRPLTGSVYLNLDPHSNVYSATFDVDFESEELEGAACEVFKVECAFTLRACQI